jgi:hypothetical protein
MAKRFFYTTAAILCLTLAYHFGATIAQGQSGGVTVTASDMEGGGSAVVASNGDVYFGLYPSSGVGAQWSRRGNVGANSQIVSLSMPDGNYIHAAGTGGPKTFPLSCHVVSAGQVPDSVEELFVRGVGVDHGRKRTRMPGETLG